MSVLVIKIKLRLCEINVIFVFRQMVMGNSVLKGPPEPVSSVALVRYAGIFLVQSDNGPLKWAKGPCPIQIHVKFRILMGLFKS